MALSTVKSGRESSAKMLLPSTPITPTVVPGMASPTGEGDENPNKFSSFLLQVAGVGDENKSMVVKDHCYARPWNWKPENIYVKPVKKLFFTKTENLTKEATDEEIVDVVENDAETPFPYDLSKTRQAMDEFQRVANFIRSDDNDDWEDKIDKILWSKEQRKIFYKIVSILNKEKTARLSRINSVHEPILRRTCLDSTAKRFRETLASTNWDLRIAQWLHGLLFDHLPQEFLAIYLDILQTIRQKIPQLVDKMIAVVPTSNSKGTAVTWETLAPLLKKTWDPVTPVLNANKAKKLPGNPILIVVPNGVSNTVSTRHQKWIAQLGMLGTVVVVNSHLGLNSSRMTMTAALEQLVQASRAKIQDVRIDYPGRPVVLIGFNSGAALACQVAQLEHVTSVICLGFPFNTVDGRRGTPDDTLLDIRSPVMFVIGEKSVLAHVDDIEDLREKMLVPTSLVVVGSGDDQLRIPSFKKISEKVSQSMVDRCVLDEIGDFVGQILLQPHPLPLRSLNSVNNHDNRGVRRGEVRKRKISTSSSVDSEPQSPNIKKTRAYSPHQTNNSMHANALPKVPLTGTASTQTPRRKPRSYANRNNYSDQMPTGRGNQQQSKDPTGGITVNIGSFASLSPVGPIRFDPTTINMQTPPANKAGNTLKSTNSFIKMAKNNQVNVGGPQNVAKIKMILPTKKIQHRGPSNFKNMNVPSDNSRVIDPSAANILTSSNAPARTNTAAATIKSVASGLPATLTTLPSINIPKNQVNSTVAVAGKSITSSSILFTPKSSTPITTSTITSTSSTAAKVSDITSPGFRGFQMHEQKPTIPIETTLQTTIKTRSPRTRAPAAPKPSPQNSRNIQVMSKPIETITPTTSAATSLTAGLENILDLPIIIANDSENINTYESLSQAAVNPSAVGGEMILIENKPVELAYRQNKIDQKSVILNRGSTVKPTVKYTRIILTKKNEGEDKGTPVILTKTRKTNKQIVQVAESNQEKVPRKD